ncbi:PucR family transcriptional regulator [Nocardia cyriacigeorgica]|uniref:PucR family transcriptional regulator n=1 Tax=Nocardia cyriacigeorgica TaxID=135487 RepID=A0A5R8NE89_9NOCA|nr:helix-turn-helix domain-containing protein [Nocardia cyriacigeorgica]TLF72857.1 PucR family transcriptional regulator [Nocardia cyriacigeorgica]
MLAALPPLAGDAPILDRLGRGLPDIADRMLAAGLGSTPTIADLPDGHFHEVVPAILACGRGFLRALREQREFTDAELARYVAPVIRRHAEERIPLRLLIDAVHGSAQQLLRESARSAAPEEMDDLVAFGAHLLDLLRRINLVVYEGYSEVEQSVFQPDREARRALCSALLHGLPVAELAARADIALEEHYRVLALRVPSEQHPLPVATLMARRRVRVLQSILDDVTGRAALHTFDGTAGVVLLPGGPHTHAEQVTATTAQRFEAGVYLADGGEVARAQLPDAAREVTDLVDLALALGRPPGSYRLDDLLLEYQLTRPGRARDRLAERIEPLSTRPHLLAALDAYLRHGTDRKTAAAEVHVHPNTFSYRLRRIAELTGLDPADPTDTRLLAAALTVVRAG